MSDCWKTNSELVKALGSEILEAHEGLFRWFGHLGRLTRHDKICDLTYSYVI